MACASQKTSYYFFLPWLITSALVMLCHPALNGSLSGEINPILHCFDTHPYICTRKTKNQFNIKDGSLLKPSFKINNITQFHVLDKFLTSRHCSMLTLSKLMIMCQTCVSLSMVAQSGDVHPNPGPRVKYPCDVCSKACKWNQNCIVCDNCETWLHKQCIGMNSLIFNQLANSSCTWCVITADSLNLALVCPHLEYCSSVWNPHIKVNIQKIEAVQRRAARFIMNDYKRESVTAMLKTLDLPSLQHRRYNNWLVMMHKIIHNNVNLPLRSHLSFSKRDSNAASTRKSNPLSLEVPFIRTNCFQKSFFPNMARDWNKSTYFSL